MNSLHGLNTLNIELTQKCNKNCFMCGRRKLEKEDPELNIYNKNIDFKLLENIAKQLPDNIVIQFHNNGEPLLYPYLDKALKLFKNSIRCFNTNGILLLEKADIIINNLETLTISTFENDPQWEEQYENLIKFLEIKGSKKPNVIIRCLGDIDQERMDLYKKLNLTIATRILHAPEGSFNYKKRNPTIPETGICWDFLSHPAINVNGDFSICVRFDPNRLGVLGNIKDLTLIELWNHPKRKEWLEYHINGERNKIDLCKKCHFWGIPTGF